MRVTVYVGLALILIPFQVTLLGSLSPFGVLPDLCLVAVCLVGFWTGPVEGLIVGLMMGFFQDLFSVKEIWLNTLTKGLLGLGSGLLAKNLTRTTPQTICVAVFGFSLFSGLGFLVISRSGMETMDIFQGIHSILLPQSLLDGIVAICASWVVSRWVPPTSVL